MNRARGRWVVVLLVLLALAALLASVAAYGMRSDNLRWRVQVAMLVARGKIPDLGFGEALGMLRPGSGYWLDTLPRTRNPYASISNPHDSAADVAAGATLFRANCSACHGADAMGREQAPALIGRNLTHGGSDWAMYRTVQRGVTGTRMTAHDWPTRDLWQTIAYVRSLDIAKQLGKAEDPVSELTAHIDVPYEDIAAVDEPGDDWLTYSGSYSGTRHSKLAQVTRDNVTHLAPRWMYQMGAVGDPLEATPIVRGGVMFVTHGGRVLALDARNGNEIWEFVRALPPDLKLCCANATRGLAILGDKLFVGTADAHLLALSAKTGKVVWQIPVVEDYRTGYSINSAPLVVRDMVITGVSGGDFPTRGFIAAYDAATGKERWRFWAVPGPGQPGNDTWAGDSWQHGGGATWLTGTYDTKQDLLYWGVGNAAPDFDAEARKGDNLYSNSALALRGTTGEKVWHFQFTPGDDHDWDSCQIPVIADREGEPQRLLWANRNGFFYVLNRQNGAFMLATPFVRQTWAERIDEHGRPVRSKLGTPSPQGTVVYPSVSGATQWWAPSYDKQLDLMIVPAIERGGLYFSAERRKSNPGELYLGGATSSVPGLTQYAKVVAIRPKDGSILWEHRGEPITEGALNTGLMSTSGGLVFASDNRTFYALDTRDGKPLWSFPTGARIAAAPISYAVDGTQYVFVSAGHTLIAFTLVDTH